MPSEMQSQLEEFIALPGSKYAVIGADMYDNDPVAQGISTLPRRFTVDGKEMVILSLAVKSVPALVTHVESAGFGIEYNFELGTNNASLLTREQALALLPTSEQ